MSTLNIFPTTIYKADLISEKDRLLKLNSELLDECLELSQSDEAGIEWSQQNYTNGFTSYASANQMQKFSSTFEELEKYIRKHVAKYVSELNLDINPKELKMSTCWVNIMPKNTKHAMHIHPLSVISGTYYVQTPKNCSAIKFEDPRYNSFMARPPVKSNAPDEFQTHIGLPAEVGKVILFESWTKHEVPTNMSSTPRVSISFNYDWC